MFLWWTTSNFAIFLLILNMLHTKVWSFPGVLKWPSPMMPSHIWPMIRHLIFVLNKHATLFYEEIFRQNKKQNQLRILWTKTAAAVYIRLFPEGVWVEKIGNILKHASASQHVQMLGVRKFKRIVSLPNSLLFQVLDAKISFLKGIPDNINCRNFAEIFPLTCGE